MQRDRVDEPLAPDYNVAPTKPVYAVMTRQPDGELALRELRVVRWGLVPSWAKDISIGSRLINARAETVSEKPAFKTAFARRRCLLPADGYYEWQQQQPAGTALRGVLGRRGLEGGPRPAEWPSGPAAAGVPGGRPPGPAGPKQPYYICRTDHRPLAFAGLYEFWRDRALAREDPDAWLWSTTIITTSATDELGEIHDRMPMVIGEESWSDWLDPANTDVADLRGLLTPAAVSGLTSYPVSLAVNSVRNNGPGLTERADPVTSGATSAASPGARARPQGRST